MHEDTIIYALTGSDPKILTGTELRRRLEFAGFKFTNAAVFYGTLKDLKQKKLINGGMVNKKRCYWAV